MKNLNGSRRLRDGAAVRKAVHTTTWTLAGYRNVIINIANEQNSPIYRDMGFFDFNAPQRIIELCGIVDATDPSRLVGGGGYDDEANIVLGRSPEVDVLLFDTSGGDVARGEDSGWHFDHFVANGVTGKPIVNVEMFGGWTKQCVTKTGEAGFYRPEDKALHYREVDAAAARPGLSVFFHSNPWCQGPSSGLPTRYNVGGSGEADDLGIRWWFEYARSRTRQP